jgi:hypothetical protein
MESSKIDYFSRESEKESFKTQTKHGIRVLGPVPDNTGLPITVIGMAGLTMLQKEPARSIS